MNGQAKKVRTVLALAPQPPAALALGPFRKSSSLAAFFGLGHFPTLSNFLTSHQTFPLHDQFSPPKPLKNRVFRERDSQRSHR